MTADHPDVAPLQGAASAVTAEGYKALFRTHPAGVVIATTSDGGRPVGFTATSVVSISAEPALIMISVQASSSSWPAFVRVRHVMLHFVDVAQHGLALRFATPGIDRFEGQRWHLSEHGVPRLDACGTWAACEVFDRLAVGAGQLLFLRPLEIFTDTDRLPVLFSDRSFRQPGQAV